MDYLTVSQVSAICHVGEDCVRGWLKKDLLQKTKAGGRTLIERARLEEFLHCRDRSESKKVA